MWETKNPEEFNLSTVALNKAINFAQSNEYSGERDLRIAILKGFEKEPYHKILGPTKKRGGPAGILLKNGYQIASWGETKRVDMTFSVTKSYLSTIAGLAVDRGFFKTTEAVVNTVWDTTFDGAHNQQITWEHILNQSSDWSGTLWGGHDWADRPPSKGSIDDWKNRPFFRPGTQFEYNDVRVNVLAYSLLQVWRKPLPQILKEYIMDPYWQLLLHGGGMGIQIHGWKSMEIEYNLFLEEVIQEVVFLSTLKTTHVLDCSF